MEQEPKLGYTKISLDEKLQAGLPQAHLKYSLLVHYGKAAAVIEHSGSLPEGG